MNRHEVDVGGEVLIFKYVCTKFESSFFISENEQF